MGAKQTITQYSEGHSNNSKTLFLPTIFRQEINVQMHHLDKDFLSICLLGSHHEFMDQIIILLCMQGTFLVSVD